MNCKPGDLAVIVRGLNGALSSRVGTLVTVGALHATNSYFGPVWNVTHMRPIVGLAVDGRNGKTQGLGSLGAKGHCPDDWLRPIRDPGDDAVDETLVGNPAPVHEGVTA